MSILIDKLIYMYCNKINIIAQSKNCLRLFKNVC